MQALQKCNKNDCCRFGLVYQEDEVDMLIPLTDMQVNVDITAGLVVMDI